MTSREFLRGFSLDSLNNCLFFSQLSGIIKLGGGVIWNLILIIIKKLLITY